MGCLANFVSPDKLLDSGDLEPGDIIEFNRLTYSHFGFHIGNGICVNVTGPDSNGPSGSSSSLSCKFSKGMKQAERLTQIAGCDRRYNKVRVNNCVLIATTLGKKQRSVSDGIELALKGLERNADGGAVLDRPIAYNYDLVGNNCEYFATRCRYYGEGFSIQVANPSMNSTLGTVERVTSAVRQDLADMVNDDDQNPFVRVGAAAAYTGYTAVGWSAYAAKTATDALLAGAASGVVGLVGLFK